jgi:hypothetical protein
MNFYITKNNKTRLAYIDISKKSMNYEVVNTKRYHSLIQINPPVKAQVV